MQPTSKTFLQVPQVTPFALSSPRAEVEKSTLSDILKKSAKSLDDAELIYEKIKTFPCFNAFFAQNFRNLEINDILDLCRNLKYESIEQNQPVYLQGQGSNGKYYVILSGEVAEVVAEKSLGNFGDDPNSATTNKLRKCPRIVIHSAPRDSAEILQHSDSKKTASLANMIKEQEKRPTTSPFQLLSVREVEAISPRTPECIGKTRKSPEEINSHRSSASTNKKRRNSSSQSKGIQRMRAVVRAVTAMRGMQKALESRLNNLNTEEGFEMDPGTLQYLDQEIEQESEDEILMQEDKKEFEEYSKKYGQLMRYITKGEGFGEQGLKKNAVRSASMICRKNCEFLILEKQQYDLVFGRVQREKEEFLRTVFPNLDLNCMSTANFNYLMCSFKTETYGRGVNVIKEGLVSQKDAKVYVIQHGECVLEKNVIKELANPYDKNKALVSTVEPQQLAVLGKGSIVGEEIIETHNQYEYGVRVTSDHVLVQAISRRDFKSKFPWDFHDFLAGIYEQKRKYRETAFERSKIKTMDQENQYKKENIYCLKNTQMNLMASKSAINGFSRLIHRENHSAKKEDAILESVITSPVIKTMFNKTDGLRSGVNFIENEEEPLSGSVSKEVQRLLSPRVQTRLKVSKDEPKTKDAMLLARIEFLNKIPKVRKEDPEHINAQSIQKAKFFPTEAKQFLTSKSKRAKISFANESSIKRSITQVTSLTTLDRTKSPKNSSIPSLPGSKVTSLQNLDAITPGLIAEASKNVTPINHFFSSASLNSIKTPREFSLTNIANSPRTMPRLVTTPGMTSVKNRGASPSEDYMLIASIDPLVRRESLASQISNRRFTKPDTADFIPGSSSGIRLKNNGRADIRPITSARAQSRDGVFIFENLGRRNTTEDAYLTSCITKKQLLVPGAPEVIQTNKVPNIFGRRNTTKVGKREVLLQTDVNEGVFVGKKRRV